MRDEGDECFPVQGSRGQEGAHRSGKGAPPAGRSHEDDVIAADHIQRIFQRRQEALLFFLFCLADDRVIVAGIGRDGFQIQQVTAGQGLDVPGDGTCIARMGIKDDKHALCLLRLRGSVARARKEQAACEGCESHQDLTASVVVLFHAVLLYAQRPAYWL